MKKELNISYESAIERLEEIVDKLASGSVSLEAVSYTHLTLPTMEAV